MILLTFLKTPSRKLTRPDPPKWPPRDPACCWGYLWSWRWPLRPWRFHCWLDRSASVEIAGTTVAAEAVEVVAEASRRKTPLRPDRCRDTTALRSSTDTRSCSAGSCATPNAIANAREDAACLTTASKQLVTINPLAPKNVHTLARRIYVRRICDNSRKIYCCPLLGNWMPWIVYYHETIDYR